MKRWHKEPLLHFLLIGAFIFGVFALVNNEEDYSGENRITVTAVDMERLSNNWSKKWNRPPTETELKGLVDSYVREEVYYREALALGLDQDDTIIRRRMMQKMEFLTNDLAELNAPDESALNEYFVDHKDRYELPPRLSFTHIYFSSDKRGAKAVEDAKNLLSVLNALPRNLSKATERGDSFMLQYDFTGETPFEVSRLFGNNFSDELFKAETNGWQGPIESGYGLHLVRISGKTDARMPELASVIDKVRTDLIFEQRQKMNKEIYERFRERYEIVVEDMPKESAVAGAIRSARESS